MNMLEGKKAIITGATGGMGEAVVEEFVKEGALVVALDLNEEKGKALVDKVNAIGPGKAVYYNCDISDRDNVFQVFEKAAEEMGGLDILAHLAAVEDHTPCEDVTQEILDKLYHVNFSGTIYTNQAACKEMKKKSKGSIINYGSVSGMLPDMYHSVYCSSKAAVMQWTRNIAAEWGRKYGIRCNSVLPLCVTPLYQKWLDSVTEEERLKHFEENREMIPLGGKPGTARQIARATVFLASDDSDYMTGTLLDLCGGKQMLH